MILPSPEQKTATPIESKVGEVNEDAMVKADEETIVGIVEARQVITENEVRDNILVGLTGATTVGSISVLDAPSGGDRVSLPESADRALVRQLVYALALQEEARVLKLPVSMESKESVFQGLLISTEGVLSPTNLLLSIATRI